MNGKAPTLIALLSGYSMQEIRSDILLMCKEEPNLRIAIGTTVDEPTEIRSSYDKAKLTLAMIPALRQQVMAYSDLGIYKMLYEIKDKELAAIHEILGYDVTLNENRFKIMMAFYLIKIRKN